MRKVKGERLEGQGKDNSHTQDFFFNNTPMIELADVDTCLENIQLREEYFDGPTRLSLALKTRTDAMRQHVHTVCLPFPGLLRSHSFITCDSDDD